MEIDRKALESVKAAADSILINELKSFYLLGDTDEYDDFEPSKINLSACTEFELYKVGCCVYAGYKIDENEEKAFQLWEKAVEAGQPDAMIELSAKNFLDGKDKEGFNYLLNSANKGNQLAQFRISVCYFLGKGIEVNPEKGFAIIQKLAEKKFPNAVYMLGSFYFNDDTLVQKDVKKGWTMIKQAADLGSPFAQYEVAIQMFTQKPEKEKLKEVIKLMEKAADGGDLRALYILSLIYAKGEGVQVDLKRAMSYLAQSFDGGFPLAVELMDKIKESAGE